MIYNTTYRNDHDIYLINQTVGKPFSFIKRLKMGGIGSKRMFIAAFSSDFEMCKTVSQETQFGFIELRPKGILVLINKQLQNFTWPIPYSDLKVEYQQDLRFSANGNFVEFKNAYLENQAFVHQIIQYQSDY